MKKAIIFDMYGVLLRRNFLLQEFEDLKMTTLLAELKERGVTLYLLSNIFVRNSSYFKNKYSFIKYFDKLYFSSDTKLVKPDPRAYQLVLRENNLKPEDCIFFDDSERNVEAARALGIEAYVFEGADHTREKVLHT